MIYVDRSATSGANNGSSWANAYTNLQTALGTATSGDQIWVARGAYTPGTTQVSSFVLKDGVGLYGGYPAGGGTRDVAANVTVLSGDIDHNDTKDVDAVTTTISGKNASHVVTTNGNNSTAILDGFTITGGNANGSSPKGRGGGMLNYSSSPTVTNCTFSGNSASRGSGMDNEFSSPTVTNCTFSGNTATYEGGGMLNIHSSTPMVTNCIFNGNSANRGGGMCNHGSSPKVTNCTFSSNSTVSGGGMFNINSSTPTVTSCTFTGNTATLEGGGMLNYSSSPDVTNCTFTGNTAYGGSGMYNYSSSPTVTNCTFSGNSADTAGGGMFNVASSSPTLINCTFNSNSAEVIGGGILNSENSNARIYNTILWGNSGKEILNDDSKPTVSDCVIEGRYADGTNIITADPKLGTLGDYGGPTETIPIEPGSSAIDAAVYQSQVTQPTTDQRGIPRPQGRACDIGAYEAP